MAHFTSEGFRTPSGEYAHVETSDFESSDVEPSLSRMRISSGDDHD